MHWGSNQTQAHLSGYLESGMAELVNLRTARKRAKRAQGDQRAQANRLAHGQPKHQRQRQDAQQTKAGRDLDGHRIEPGDGR